MFVLVALLLFYFLGKNKDLLSLFAERPAIENVHFHMPRTFCCLFPKSPSFTDRNWTAREKRGQRGERKRKGKSKEERKEKASAL